MKRLLLVGTVAVAVLVPSAVAAPPAGTGTLRGIVIAKDPSRHALVVARPGGTVQMLAAPTSALRTKVGRTVVIRYRIVPGGLAKAQSVTLKGHARRVVVRGMILRLVKQRALLNAGGSVLGLTLKQRAHQRTLASVASGPHVGETVTVEAEIDDDGTLGAATILASAGSGSQDESGGELEVRGTVSAFTAAGATTPGSISVTVHGLVVTCAIPAADTVTAAVGDLVEIECELVGDPAVWTLRQAEGDDEDEGEQAESGHHGGHGDHGHDDDDDDGGDD